ncbi:MAG: MraY family glycosyltransferase [Planctomycetota bacterium]|nr:MraY family glycosyltransferase [Planctomycetota bacterium]
MTEHRTWSSLARTRGATTIGLAAVGAGGLLTWRTPVEAGVFILCTLAAGLLVPRIARWAMRRRILALPGGRAPHTKRTPRAGGIALFVPVAITLLGMGVLGDRHAWGLLVGSVIVFTCGLVDDVRGVRPRMKILMQVAAAGALLAAGYRLPILTVPGLGAVSLGIFEVPTILLWVVLASNAFNLSDGLDGLAASLAMVGLAVLTAGGVGSPLPIALAGTCLGFLHYNMPRARIFLGDSGSLLLGFLLAALALELPVQRNLPYALAALAYPLADVVVSVMRRFARGKPIFSPDSSHLHHKVVQFCGSPRRGLFVLLAFAAAHGAFAILWPGVVSITLSGVLCVVTLLTLARLASFRAVDVLDGRTPMRYMHALQRYVRKRIDAATTAHEVERAMQHFIEGSRVCSVTIGTHEIVNRHGCCAEAGPDDIPFGAGACETHPIRMMVGHAAWSAPRGDARDVLRRERETLVVQMVRCAHARLLQLDGGTAWPPAAERLAALN